MSRKHHDHPDFDAAPKAAAAAAHEQSQAAANVQHPEPGVPTDADGFLAFLKAGTFTDAQLRYLRGALPVYAAAVAPGKDTKADEILSLLQAIVAANPASGNAFNP